MRVILNEKIFGKQDKFNLNDAINNIKNLPDSFECPGCGGTCEKVNQKPVALHKTLLQGKDMAALNYLLNGKYRCDSCREEYVLMNDESCLHVECPGCGGSLVFDLESDSATCEYCKTTYLNIHKMVYDKKFDMLVCPKCGNNTFKIDFKSHSTVCPHCKTEINAGKKYPFVWDKSAIKECPVEVLRVDLQ